MEPRKKYNYLTIEDRAIIAHELRNGNSIRCVARKVKKPLSTVAYEIKKKTGYRYMAGKADQITKQRLKERGAKLCAKLHLDFLDFINENFDKKHQSLQLLLREWRKSHSDAPSLATLYNWIPKGVFDFNYQSLLKPRKKRKNTIARWKRMVDKPISYRKKDYPNYDREFGHWEGDLIVGSTKNHGYVLTMVERKSRCGLTMLLNSKKSNYVLDKLKLLIHNNKKLPFKSITFDNGLEFTQTSQLESSVKDLQVYFAFPYSSW